VFLPVGLISTILLFQGFSRHTIHTYVQARRAA